MEKKDIPVRGENTQGEHELVQTADLPSDVLWRHFTAEHRHDDTAATKSNASDDASDVEEDPRVRVDGLEHSTDNEDEGANRDGPLATESMGDGPDGEACNEGAELLQADGEGADGGRIRRVVAEVALERFQGQDSAYDARVVADCADRVSREVRLPLPQW